MAAERVRLRCIGPLSGCTLETRGEIDAEWVKASEHDAEVRRLNRQIRNLKAQLAEATSPDRNAREDAGA